MNYVFWAGLLGGLVSQICYVPSSCDSDSRYFYQKHTSNYFQKVFSNGRHIFLPKQVNGPNKAV